MARTHKSIVQRAARQLDSERPGWAYQIKLRTLDWEFAHYWKAEIRARRGRSGTQTRPTRSAVAA